MMIDGDDDWLMVIDGDDDWLMVMIDDDQNHFFNNFQNWL